VRLEVHATTQGHAGGQYIQYGQLNDARSHGHINVGVFRQRDIQAQGTGLGQWRIFRGQTQHRGTVGAGNARHFHQFTGATGVGNNHEQLTGMCHRGDHALHQHVGVGGDGQVEAEELVLRIQRHRSRCTQTKKVDLPGLDQQVDSAADKVGVQCLAGTVQRGDGAAEDFLCVGSRIIVSLDGTAHVSCAAGQALCQLQL